MAVEVRRIAILGAGKLGVTLAQLALKAGYEVFVAGSQSPAKIALAVEVLTPGAKAMTAENAVKNADVVVLALPLGRFRNIPKAALANKLVIDAMNHWWEVDGERDLIMAADVSSSQAVQQFLSSSRVVKALNHMGYHDLHDGHTPVDSPRRKAIAVAGDNAEDIETVNNLIDMLGFDPVYIGELHEGSRLEPGTNVFGASVGADSLKRLLSTNAE
ncbi:MAG: NAD(P)-binding domain-containing protein [Patescibacteria group bacterium]